MTSILGIDAAWTATEPSGIALLVQSGNEWLAVCVAPNYDSFIDSAKGIPIDWNTRYFGGSKPNISKILDAARELGGSEVDLIALDIPLAHTDIITRRASDSAISRAFGGHGCAAHSPSTARPGPISTTLYDQLKSNGYHLQTVNDGVPQTKQVIEVYPHPALLTFLGRTYRVPYKVSKSGKYWKGQSLRQRRINLVDEFEGIYARLLDEFGTLPFNLPNPNDVPTLTYLKRYEDALDGLVCAWVGQQHLLGRTLGYGDNDSTIWVPKER